MKKIATAILLIASFSRVNAQDTLLLYPKVAPPGALVAHDIETQTVRPNGTKLVAKVSDPTLTVYLPPKAAANGTAILICPGGGYSGLAITHEGHQVAQAFNKLGVAAFVLKYRLPDDRIMRDKSVGPLQDAQTGLSIIRKRAKEWGIDEHKVGIIGFSAGGHLASTVGTHFNKAVIDNKDNINLRPDFMVLMYPVISFTDTSLVHGGSRNNLIGKNASEELKVLYSNELQVTPQTPPTLLVHAGDDQGVKVGNSIRFYEALNKNGVLAEMIIYPKGGHGFGLNNKTTTDNWMERCREWMKSNGWL